MDMQTVLTRIKHSFLFIAGGSFLSMYIYGQIFGYWTTFTTRNIIALSIMNVLINLACFIFYSKKELNRVQMLGRYVIHGICIFSIVLFGGIVAEFISWQRPMGIIVLALLIMAVYAIVICIEMFLSKRLVDKMNKKLEEHHRK